MPSEMTVGPHPTVASIAAWRSVKGRDRDYLGMIGRSANGRSFAVLYTDIARYSYVRAECDEGPERAVALALAAIQGDPADGGALITIQYHEPNEEEGGGIPG